LFGDGLKTAAVAAEQRQSAAISGVMQRYRPADAAGSASDENCAGHSLQPE